ncbi:MAG TPA: hypothetical protein VFZ59_09140 [Verrucomicrobiae bacterium]|nr:hypothetical protein [Verrucomicrobiae bacterium]
MKEIRAIAEIAVNTKQGWNLPTFGSKKPDQFRYWAHVHFEKDATWGQQTWTLILDLDKDPVSSASQLEATVYFMSPNAPHHLLAEEAKFELVCGESHYTNGVIKRVFEVEK